MLLPIIDKSKIVKIPLLREGYRGAARDVYQDMENLGKVKPSAPTITMPGANTKLSKQSSRSDGYAIYSLFLAPADVSGYEMCLWRTEDCTKLCLNCAGKGALSSVQQARIRKTKWLVERPRSFFYSLVAEMQKISNKHYGSPITPVMRLNGTSDLPWDQICPEFFTFYGGIGWRFYDYTKSVQRAEMQPWDNTLSFSGHNWADCERLLRAKKCRVAVVFDTKRGQPLPTEYKGFPVIDGDADDLCFLDDVGLIRGLRYKRVPNGNINTPFVVSTK